MTVGRLVMGTVLQVTVAHAERDTARRLAEEAFVIAGRWDDVLTTWRPEGELARLNAAPSGTRVAIGADLERALRRMAALHAATGGSFDPAVGRLVRWWAKLDAERASEPMPPALPWPRAITIGKGWAALAPGVSLDAGGIGKGIALDAIAQHLRAAGVRSAFLDFGRSSLLAIGAPAREPRGWPVALTGIEPGELRGVVYLRDRAASTSWTIAAGDEVGAIIDPATGRPVVGPRGTTLVGPSAADAEAWSKAVIVRGRVALEDARAAGYEAILRDEEGWSATSGLGRDLEELAEPSAAPSAAP